MLPSSPCRYLPNCWAANAEPLANDAAGVSFGQHLTDDGYVSLNQLMAAHSLARHVGARDVGPMISSDNFVNHFDRDAVILGDVFSVFTVCNSAQYLRSVSLGNLGRAGVASDVSAMQIRIVRMLDVFRARNPLKVFNAIVGFDAVNVVSLMRRAWSRASKGFKNQNMNAQGTLTNSRANRRNSQVSEICHALFQNAISARFGGASKSLDVAKRASGVIRFPAGNGFPVFHAV